tara:strand:- start:3346 stop:6333 length:2988 start_codon:yes stop_codon:yes gene_type:complete
MTFEPDKIKKEHVLTAVEKIKAENRDLRSSTKYDVLIEGEAYPPKEIMRYAHEMMNGEHLWEYGGGEQTNKFFKSMGFEIVQKNSDTIPDKNVISTTELLLNSINEKFPDFEGFSDSRFLDSEITYKQRIIKDAQEKLSKKNLKQLLNEQKYEEFYNEVHRIGRHKDNNLLYRGTPSTGDLALLNNTSLDYKSFTMAFFELLYGEATGAERLETFSKWSDEQKLPNKWTFVTYFLFVTNPGEELFVKPTEIRQFLEMLGKGHLWHHRPTGELYQTIKDDLWAVGDSLPYKVEEGFLDLQSFLWSAISAQSNLYGKVKNYLKKFAEEADNHFSEQTDFLEPRYRFFQSFFKKENLAQAKWNDFQEMGNKVHALATNAMAYKNAFGNPNHEIEHYRKSFLYLAYGDNSLDSRIDSMLDKKSDYHVKYLGESFYGELVGYLFPDDYVFYNRRDKEAVDFLKLSISRKRGETFGKFYVRYNEEIKPLIDIYEVIVGQRTQTTIPLELDQFFSWLYENHLPSENEPLENIEELTDLENEFWLYSPGPSADYWDEFYEEQIMAIGWDYLGDLRKFQTKSEIRINHQEHQDTEISKKNDTSACWEFVSGLEIGDVIIAKSGQSKLIGYGIVASDYFFDDSREFYKHVRKVNWKKKGEWPIDHKLIPKTLTNVSGYPTEHPDYEYFHERLLGEMGVNIREISSDLSDQKIEPTTYIPYSIHDALLEVFMDEKELQKIVNLIGYKRNIILQGPPGTGKTFLAKRLAWLMMGVKDPNRIEMVQFHPSYSYEDFIRGYRPTENHFELKDGIFLETCNKAKSNPGKSYFLIIDEINRGNLSKIFGELMMLIEKDKRGKDFTVSLPYKKSSYEPDFYIPENLYLIGTMNTADRSLAMVDYALRRRFVFIDMLPNFGVQLQKHLLEQGVEEHLIDIIVQRLDSLNEKISNETGLGKDFQIGHSYFCHTKNGNEEWFKNIIRYEILPLLKEYWFDKTNKVDEIEEELLTL